MNTPQSPLVQIFILSRNRVKYLKESLESCLALKYDNFKVIVSENSTDHVTREFLQNHEQRDKFDVVLRNNLSYPVHTNRILSEVTAPYFMMFHDDDVLLPSCLHTYIEVMSADDTLSAVGGNSLIIENENRTNRDFMRRKTDCKVSTVRAFFENYFVRVSSHPAYPTYLFRASKVAQNRLASRKGGGHSDSAFMFENLKNGPMYFSTKTIALYRVHQSNMSGKINMRHITALVRYLKSQAPEETTLLLNYKYIHWVKHYFRGEHGQLKPRDRIIIFNVLKFFLRHPYFVVSKVLSKIRSKSLN
ncbi:MAG: glycosyltransferase family 2 protein [Bdellovibrionota bacterium]